MRRILTYAIVIISFLFSFVSSAQKKVDTIDVAKGFKPIIIFPDNIAESILGDDLFFDVQLAEQSGSEYSGRIVKLSYNEASKAREDYTNFTVITNNGNMYNFILKLTKRPSRVNWIITPEMAAANINGKKIVGLSNAKTISEELKNSVQEDDGLKVVEAKINYYSKDDETVSFDGSQNKDSLTVLTSELYDKNIVEYYRARSYYMQFDKESIPRYYSRNGRVALWLKGVYYDKNEIYFQFKFDNREGVDYDINMLKFFICTKKPISCAEHRSVYEFKVPKRVKGQSENHFVVVFKKFSLSKNRHLKVEVDETHGTRNITLYIDHKTINNPIRL